MPEPEKTELEQEAIEKPEVQEPTPEEKTLTEFDTILEEKPEEKQEQVEADKTEKTSEVSDDEYEDIPQDQIDAGQAAGLADEAIEKLAEENPVVLKALADFHKRSVSTEKAEEKKVEKDESVEVPKALEHIKVPELDFKDEKVTQLFEGLVASQNQLIDRTNQADQTFFEQKKAALTAQKKQAQEFDTFVDDYFDTKVKENPEFGQSKSLTDGQLSLRDNVFAIAKALPNGKWEERLDDAVKMWGVKSGNSEKAAESRVAAKLDSQKKKFIARPTGRKAKKDTRTAEEKTLADMDVVAEKHGTTIGK